MSVCVSGCLAGISVVLIKYIRNVWLQLLFYGRLYSLQKYFEIFPLESNVKKKKTLPM